MDDRYEAFLMADPVFYDALRSENSAESFPAAERPLPEGWKRQGREDWVIVSSGNADLPAQGWKIHISGCRDNAERIVDVVWDYCLPRGIDFKFLRSQSVLWSRVSKYAPRGYSGKLVTIYPVDDSVCETILNELGEVLEGEPGPYILSDLRWGKGPLHVRYGAFTDEYCVDDSGQIVLAITDDTGTLVPDTRDPVFRTPSWVTLPDFLAPHLVARNAVTVADLPYTIERPLHFSNGGGIYLGRDNRTGEQVVFKEGRPHAGLDGLGHDAVRRVEHEHDMLRRLEGIPGIPKVHDFFWLGEHRFLVMEYVKGSMLSGAIVSRYPLIKRNVEPEEHARYADWALDIYRQVEDILAAVNERGVVYGDLHLWNIVVREDDTIALLDFEVGSLVEQAIRPGLGNQGFAAPRGATGLDIDRYALACMRFALFLPTMTTLLWLCRPKVRHFAEIITEQFPVPPEFLTKAIEIIAPPGTPPTPDLRIEPDPGQWPRLRDDLVRSIVASATPDRDDRLFPGDIQQFEVGGLGLAHGAAGVLYALSAVGADRHPKLEQWLVQRVANPARGSRLGLYDGLHGAAFALDHLGYQQEALDTLDRCLREKWETLGPDLSGGLAGIGLNLLHLADRTGEPALRAAAHRAAELVAEQFGDEDPDLAAGDWITGDEISGGTQPWAGLMRGCAGQALLLLRAYDDTGDTGFLDRAAVALRQDLRRCTMQQDGSLQVNEGWRTMPYLSMGSVGIGMVLDDYLAYRHDERFAEASRRIEFAAHPSMYVQPELFAGRAGILLYLAGRSSLPATDPLVAKQVRNLAWHALPYADGMAFPGTALMRLSMDLATGTAGVLIALGAALHDVPVHAPLLTSARRPAAPTPQTPAPTGAGG